MWKFIEQKFNSERKSEYIVSCEVFKLACNHDGQFHIICFGTKKAVLPQRVVGKY